MNAQFNLKIFGKDKDCKGFTLIELLVVISLIGILMAISLVAFAQTKKSARDGKRKADLEQIRSALEIYRTDCKTYPLDSTLTFGSATSLAGVETSCAGQVYMSSIPNDPVSSTRSYYYHQASTNNYILCAFLETGSSTSFPDCASHCGTTACNYRVTNP